MLVEILRVLRISDERELSSVSFNLLTSFRRLPELSIICVSLLIRLVAVGFAVLSFEGVGFMLVAAG